MEAGSSKKRTREPCWRTIKMREMGLGVIQAIMKGEIPGDVTDFPVDPRAEEESRRRFPKKICVGTEVCGYPLPNDVPVPTRLQVWRKDLQSSFRIKQAKKQLDLKKQSDLSRLNIDEEELDDKSDYYPCSDIYRQLDLRELFNGPCYQRDLVRYTRDKEKSDGFDVGYYPYLDPAGICSSGFIFPHYKPPDLNLPRAYFNTLVLLSQLAISVYDMYQLDPTPYDNVQVLKAMKFGPYTTNYNITFQASFPTSPTTFQTRVYNRCYPAFSKYLEFEIVLVRKFKGGEDASNGEFDYVGDQSLPGFPSSMDSISDFKEQDPHKDITLSIPSEEKLPLYLCQFALHQYNIALHLHDEDRDNDDELYDNVKVLNILKTLKTLDDEHGTTYYITFAASLLDDNGNPQIFETKCFMSPLVPTTKIKIKFVRIKDN